MRALLLVILLVCCRACAADTAADWFARACDPALSLRAREYAANQVLMLADSSASILIAAIKDTQLGLARQVAAGLLGQTDLRTAQAPLLEAAFDKDWFLAEAAANALAGLYSALEDTRLYTLYSRGMLDPGETAAPGEDDWIVLSLAQERHRSRFRTIVMHAWSIKYSKAKTAPAAPVVNCVWDALLAPNKHLQLRAVDMAGKTHSPQAPERLAALLWTQTDPDVLTAALRALALMRAPGFADAIERHVHHANPMVALEALAALDAAGDVRTLFPDAPGHRAVASFVVHPETKVRRRAVEILAASHDPAALPYLTQAVFDRSAPNRAAAARALGELGFTGAVGALSPLLQDGRPEVREQAAIALARLGVVGITAKMADDLRGNAMPFQRAAARALGHMGDAHALGVLTEGLQAADQELACLCAESLGRLKQPAAARPLFHVLEQTDDPVRAQACRAALAMIFGDDPSQNKDWWPRYKQRYNVE